MDYAYRDFDIKGGRQSIEERFWEKVTKTDSCWLWEASNGMFWDGTVAMKVPRYSWVLHNGPLKSGASVEHTCNTTSCVNPAHLRLGRRAPDLAAGVELLDDDALERILAALDKGVPATLIAKKHGLSTKAVDTIRVTRELPEKGGDVMVGSKNLAQGYRPRLMERLKKEE